MLGGKGENIFLAFYFLPSAKSNIFWLLPSFQLLWGERLALFRWSSKKYFWMCIFSFSEVSSPPPTGNCAYFLRSFLLVCIFRRVLRWGFPLFHSSRIQRGNTNCNTNVYIHTDTHPFWNWKAEQIRKLFLSLSSSINSNPLLQSTHTHTFSCLKYMFFVFVLFFRQTEHRPKRWHKPPPLSTHLTISISFVPLNIFHASCFSNVLFSPLL